ncbi:MAG: Kynureninase [Steroidobacteraceae bacterium]|nr:Kynureninase [Steroidobacteraceae bacterium]
MSANREDAATAWRARFALPRSTAGEPLVYFCGHSLGLMPLAARQTVDEELESWATLGIDAQFTGRRPWVDYASHVTAGFAALAGALTHEVVAMNALTVNLHFLMASFYRPQGTRRRVLVEAGAFPSDRHAVAAQIAWHGLDPRECLLELAPREGEDLLRADDIDDAIARAGDSLALVLWPGVQYLTGQAFDLARIARAARHVGAAVGFDLAHAIGNIPLALHESGADFAAWCSYKYLNAGPGAIGGAFVHERHAQRRDLPRLSGWWGNDPATRFRMAPEFDAARGAAGWQVSNPPIFSTAPLLASLAIFAEVGLPRLRERSIALTRALEAEIDALPANEVTLITPRDVQERGAQLSVRIRGSRDRGRHVHAALTAHGIVCDWREPGILRIAPVPLYNTIDEVHRCGRALRDALAGAP